MSTSTLTKIGRVAVDSGRIVLVDPCYLDRVDEHGNAVNQSCELTTLVNTRQDGWCDVMADVDETVVITEIRIIIPDEFRSACRQWSADQDSAR